MEHFADETEAVGVGLFAHRFGLPLTVKRPDDLTEVVEVAVQRIRKLEDEFGELGEVEFVQVHRGVVAGVVGSMIKHTSHVRA